MLPASRFAHANILDVLDALPVGLMMVSPEGVVLHMNPALAALTGFDADDVRGLPCRHVLRSRLCVSGCLLGCGAFGPPSGKAGGESDILTLKKRRIPVRLTHFPVLDKNSKELFRLDVVEDLTALKHLEHRLHQAHGHGRLVGRSAAMERIAALIPSIAPATAPVFITGETGTGKDILAETLHQASPRSREPFIRLGSIGPMPEDLLLPEIFGQAGPDRLERPGRFQQAAGGTLYISEIADIPKGIQARLVHFLDTGAILPVGAVRENHLDVRLVTATHRDPAELLATSAISEDLYHRLNVIHLALPPLRERREDIDFLLIHFLERFAARFKKTFDGFTADARSILAAHDYPGNVRELRNIVEYAVMVADSGQIGVASLPAHLARKAPTSAPRARTAPAGTRSAKRRKP